MGEVRGGREAPTLRMHLPPLPESVRAARNFIRTALASGEQRHLIDDAQWAISEVVTNAVVHADTGSTVDITIVIDDHDCVMEVGNSGTSPDGAGLRAQLPEPLTIGGRGLPLIAALADTAAFTPGPAGQVSLRISKRLTPESL